MKIIISIAAIGLLLIVAQGCSSSTIGDRPTDIHPAVGLPTNLIS